MQINLEATVINKLIGVSVFAYGLLTVLLSLLMIYVAIYKEAHHLFYICMFGGIIGSAVNAYLLAIIYDKNETRLTKRIKLLKLKLNISKLK